MSELNIFLSALQSAFATSVQQAVASATAPLVERIATLEQRITALENNPAIGVDTTLERRVAVLEGAPSVLASQYTPISNEQFKAMLEEWDIGRLVQRVAVLEGSHQMSADAFVTHLDNQEWFWEKLTRKAHEAAEAAAEAAMYEHTSSYDHDDYDQASSNLSNYDLDDFVTNSGIEEAVNDVLKNATVSISI